MTSDDVLKAFGPEIWIAQGPTVTAAAGFHYPTRMAVIRLTGGGLFIWSPIQLSDSLRAQVSALGDVHYLAPPNSLHHVFLGEWQKAYPDARTYAPPGLRDKRWDIRFDGDFDGPPIADWMEDLDLAIMRGNLITTEVVFFHRRSCTVLFTDLVQQFRPGWFKGWRAIVARLDLMTGVEAAVPRKFRIAFADRRAARAALHPILTWPAENVLMAHGDPVIGKGREFIRRAFHWLI
ncbi:DUF4336 domain-containing protein [Aquabacter sp. CN5-332]|uniref:DUF4336 domain-containing protein n=1 Tax=Aquabacter sp. CN5-332 TaxID=3156608 RepID=UPI0032B3F8F4